MTSRRSFFRRVVGLVGAVVAWPFVGKSAAPVTFENGQLYFDMAAAKTDETVHAFWIWQAEKWVPLEEAEPINTQGNTNA